MKAELYFLDSPEENPIWSKLAESEGTTQLEVEKEDLLVDIGEEMQKSVILQIILRDSIQQPDTIQKQK